MTLGCSRTSSTAKPADDGASDGNVDAGAATQLASNGVPIPAGPLHPQPSCAQLGVETIACPSPSCPDVTCDCNGTPLLFNIGCIGAWCLTSVSCPAACALGADIGDVFSCVTNGVCRDDGDCAAGSRCLKAPGETRGECETKGPGSDCLQSSDCTSGLCVAGSDGSRFCETGAPGSPCNLDGQCVGQQHCVLEAGTWAGKCTDGLNRGPCLHGDDCQAPLVCLYSLNVCSTRADGAPCNSSSDCRSGAGCTSLGCSSGETGAPCTGASDCISSFCVQNACSAGAPGDPCSSSSDCKGACAARNGFPAVCTDGQLGSPCSPIGSECRVGLHCVNDGVTGVCAGAGAAVGAACRLDTDCTSQKCSGLSGAPGAVCTEGRLGQRCRESQCGPGGHCISDGVVGVCVAGAAGDPCHQPGDCLSGSCLPATAPQTSPCAGADFTACGERGACIGGDCFSQTCAGGADASSP